MYQPLCEIFTLPKRKSMFRGPNKKIALYQSDIKKNQTPIKDNNIFDKSDKTFILSKKTRCY